MRNTKRTVLAMIACSVIGTPAFAKAYLGQNGGCVSNENAQVSINFNGTDKDVAAVKTKLDAKVQEIKTLAADQHFTKFDVQSNNYSINSNYSNGYGSEPQFNYSGSASFTIQPADKAVEFMVLLTKRGYQSSVNVSSYNNGNCPQTLEK